MLFAIVTQCHYAFATDVVDIDFFILSKAGKPAFDASLVSDQINFLNDWYQGTVRFRKKNLKILTAADTRSCTYTGKTVNPEDYFTLLPDDLHRSLKTLRECYASPTDSAISVFIASDISGNMKGLVEDIFIPLRNGTSTSPSIIIAHEAGIGTFMGITLAHEIGHIMGMQHTTHDPIDYSTSVRWFDERIEVCNRNFSYPSFKIDDLVLPTLPPLHNTYAGFNNIMGTPSLHAVAGLSLFSKGYDSIFREHIKCWLTVSKNSVVHDPSGFNHLNAAGPAVTAINKNNKALFYRGQDNAIHMSRYTSSGYWGPFISLGGNVTSGPAAVQRLGRIDLFAQGPNLQYYHKALTGVLWSTWRSLGGGFYSPPSAVSWGNDRVDLFGVGRDHRIWQSSLVNQSWTPWRAIGPMLVNPLRLGVASRGVGKIDLVYKDHATHIESIISYDESSGWGTPVSLGTRFSHNEGSALVATTPTQLDLFQQNEDDHAYYRKTLKNNKWSTWQKVGGGFTSPPAAFAIDGNLVELFGRGLDGSIWSNSYTTSWSGFTKVGGEVTFHPD